MSDYQAPEVTELGDVATFTQAEFFEPGADGGSFLGIPLGGTPDPVS